MTKSLQLEEISKVTIVRYISIVFALSFGYFLFGETYGWVELSGMGLAIVGVVGNLWFKQKK